MKRLNLFDASHPSCSMKPVIASAFTAKDGRQYRDFVPDWSPIDIVIV